MSTDYTLTLTASDGTEGQITIIDSINPLPGSDKWEAADASQWGTAGGAVSSWASTKTYLTAPPGVQSIVLEGFTKDTAQGDEGTGVKNYTDGSFPDGDFTWKCTGKS